MSVQIWIALLVGVAAMADDLARRHIANWIPLAALAGGFGWHIGRAGWTGLLTASTGAAAGFSVFLVFYLLGGMGGGDVKLMAGFGALLGAALLLQAALWTAAIGGVIAVGALLWKYLRKRGAPRRADGEPAHVKLAHFKPAQAEPDPEQKLREDSIPYAPAITLGVWLSLLLKD